MDTLCNNLIGVKYLLKGIRKSIKNGEDKKVLLELVTDTLERVAYAKKQGQKMENRLRRYVYAVESLGFKRIRK